MPRWAGALALGALVAITALNRDHDPTIGAAMVATAVIISARGEGLGILAPIGRRAYSLYLWNWPMTVLFGSLDPIAPIVPVLAAAVSCVTLTAARIHT